MLIVCTSRRPKVHVRFLLRLQDTSDLSESNLRSHTQRESQCLLECHDWQELKRRAFECVTAVSILTDISGFLMTKESPQGRPSISNVAFTSKIHFYREKREDRQKVHDVLAFWFVSTDSPAPGAWPDVIRSLNSTWRPISIEVNKSRQQNQEKVEGQRLRWIKNDAGGECSQHLTLKQLLEVTSLKTFFTVSKDWQFPSKNRILFSQMSAFLGYSLRASS